MDIRPIRTDRDHRAALTEIEALWGAEEGTPEGDRIDVLATLVEAYEARWKAGDTKVCVPISGRVSAARPG